MTVVRKYGCFDAAVQLLYDGILFSPFQELALEGLSSLIVNGTTQILRCDVYCDSLNPGFDGL